jgi:arylsulfatase A
VHVRNTTLKSTRDKYLQILAERHKIAGGIPDTSETFDKKPRSIWEEANYAAMMEDMNTSISIVLDKLKALGLEENTYVIFSSDNGGGSRNTPLQGGKAKMWEGGLRVPMIVADPGIAANSQCDQPVAQWDYLTTMHDLVGSKAPLPTDLDGISLRPVFEKGNAGKLVPRDTDFVFHFPAHYTTPITAYRAGDYKLMRHLNTGEIKLFNLAQDVGESDNLSEEKPDRTRDMIHKLDAYLKKVGAWTMEEVYDTRQEELEAWIERDRKKVTEINQKLIEGQSNAAKSKALQAKLKAAQTNLIRHQNNLNKLAANRKSTSWF